MWAPSLATLLGIDVNSEGPQDGAHKANTPFNLVFAFVVCVEARQPTQTRAWRRATPHGSKGRQGGAH